MRTPDNQIPAGELLYRAVRSDSVFEGGALSPAAVDAEGTSVYRSTYSTPDEVMADLGCPLVAETTPRRLEGSVPCSTNKETYEFFAVDAPTEQTAAHAEVRWRKHGHATTEHKIIGSKAARAELKAALAKRFTLRNLTVGGRP